jgi:hypothetical protein
MSGMVREKRRRYKGVLSVGWLMGGGRGDRGVRLFQKKGVEIERGVGGMSHQGCRYVRGGGWVHARRWHHKHGVQCLRGLEARLKRA